MAMNSNNIMGGNATFRAQAQAGKAKVSGKAKTTNLPGGGTSAGNMNQGATSMNNGGMPGPNTSQASTNLPNGDGGMKKSVRLGPADLKMVKDLGISKKGYARNKAGM